MELYFKYVVTLKVTKKEMLLNIIPSLGSWIVGNTSHAFSTDLYLVLFGGIWLTGYLIDDNSVSSIGLILLTTMYFWQLFDHSSSAMFYNERLKTALGLDVSNESNDDVIEREAVSRLPITPDLSHSRDNILQINLMAFEF